MRLRDAHDLALVGAPSGHGEGVRHDARAGLQALEARLQPVDEPRQQVNRDHGGPGNVRGEHVALDEGHALGHVGAARVLARLLHQRAVELDPEAARAELLRRRDHDAAVARAEIHHEVVGSGAGELEHAVHHLIRRGDERNAGERILRRHARR